MSVFILAFKPLPTANLTDAGSGARFNGRRSVIFAESQSKFVK